MKYYARVGLGALLGILVAVGVAFLADSTWPVALAGGLAAPIGFLATFFVWSADRAPTPQEPQGYEQVLFDRPNLLHVAVLLVVVAGGAYGHAFAFGDEEAPAPDPMAAELDAMQLEVVGIAQDFNAAHDAFASGSPPADAGDKAQEAKSLAERIGALTVSDSLAARKDALADAAENYAAAFETLAGCVDSQASTCIEARIAQAKAAQALEEAAA